MWKFTRVIHRQMRGEEVEKIKEKTEKLSA